jgi:hypothetical protein
VIKTAADRCANLAQLNIQWLKLISKAAAKKYPDGIPALLKLLRASNNDNESVSNCDAV